MSKFLFFLSVMIFLSCGKRSECPPYSYNEGIKMGVLPDKKANLQFSDSLEYTLDYVRDASSKYGSYGNLEIDSSGFSEILKGFVTDTVFKVDKVRMITLYGGNDDISKGETLKRNNIDSYSIVYIDSSSYVNLMYVNEKNNVKEIYKVSQTYASVKNYFSKTHSMVQQNKCIIDIKNKDCDLSGAILISQQDDVLFQKAKSFNNK